MKTIHNQELSELVMRLHDAARELVDIDNMQNLNANELRTLADRIQRVGRRYEYTKEEQFAIDYAMAVDGGSSQCSHRHNH